MAMKGFQRLPRTLYRIQSGPVRLRDFDTQMKLNRASFDLKLVNGLVQPMPAGSEFHTPNGMSLRPAGDKMVSVLNDFRGSFRIYRMHEGLLLPKDLIVYHEHTDHFSLQTTVPIKLDEFNQKLEDLLASLPSQTKDEFLDEYNDPSCQDN